MQYINTFLILPSIEGVNTESNSSRKIIFLFLKIYMIATIKEFDFFILKLHNNQNN